MSVYLPVIQGTFNVLPSSVRTATQIIVGAILLAPVSNNSLVPPNPMVPDASGLVAYLNVTAVPGTDTVQLVLEEQDPVSLVWSTVAATTATAVTGMVRLKIKPSITAVAATTTGVTVQDVLPAIWRIRVVHSAGSNFTYSLGLVVYN